MHIIIMTTIAVLTFIGGLVLYASIGYAEKEKLKEQVGTHEVRLNEYEKNMNVFKETQLEIRINLKTLMEKQGIKFQTKE